MSRSGYSDDLDDGTLNCWRGAVKKAIEGKRGQAFLKEMLVALDTLPQKRLIKSNLIDNHGDVCALGSVGLKRHLSMKGIDVHDTQQIGNVFNIARAMAAEIECVNDNDFSYMSETPEQRFTRVRYWVLEQIKVKENSHG